MAVEPGALRGLHSMDGRLGIALLGHKAALFWFFGFVGLVTSTYSHGAVFGLFLLSVV
jgi:hypothetical protein